MVNRISSDGEKDAAAMGEKQETWEGGERVEERVEEREGGGERVEGRGWRGERMEVIHENFHITLTSSGSPPLKKK